MSLKSQVSGSRLLYNGLFSDYMIAVWRTSQIQVEISLYAPTQHEVGVLEHGGSVVVCGNNARSVFPCDASAWDYVIGALGMNAVYRHWQHRTVVWGFHLVVHLI